jgi:hypothetical protein
LFTHRWPSLNVGGATPIDQNAILAIGGTARFAQLGLELRYGSSEKVKIMKFL